MNNFFKQCLKKLHKTGLFHSFEIAPGYLSYRDTHGNKYVVQKAPNKFGYYFRIGRVHEWTERGPTYESGYNSMGDIHKAAFIDAIDVQHTDSPDYITRASKWFLIG